MGWGVIPLLVYVVFVAIEHSHPIRAEIVFAVCTGVTALTLFVMGIIKVRFYNVVDADLSLLFRIFIFILGVYSPKKFEDFCQ